MSDTDTPFKAVNYIRDKSEEYAKAVMEREYLDQFRKTKKALLMNERPSEPQHVRESYAYAHADYIQVIESRKIVRKQEIELKWMIEAAKLKIEIWRTEAANNRFAENL